MPFECPFCFEPHDAPASDAGRSVTCQCCGTSFVVPLVTSAPLLAPAAPQAPPLVVTYCPEEHGGDIEPDAGDNHAEPDDNRPRRAPRGHRLQQARETRAKWMLLIKIGVVVALGGSGRDRGICGQQSTG